ncbi:uncharacterized protein At3g27210-like [Phalaenopsis equestris]|uniref:uncharacterized protein At3g27210-like n=1 Tax=Phalaenopsis equestris TaxID=78828 RepID=UPI0009E55C0C|nr:uncharacterized protein At3g27210-like [Phalaenopsis equestris]
MGTCSSAQKRTDSTVKASNGVSFKAKEVFISSPIKEKALNEENSEFGSKEEKFFDSKLWLDTDGEDEFLSVNGDFTPSRCSTPNHESIKLMTPKRSTSLENFPRPKPETSSTGRKKLAELLRETSQGEKHSIGELQTEANGYQNSNLKVGRSSAYGSGDGTAVTCCLPSLLQTNGFNEKRKMNPLHCCA